MSAFGDAAAVTPEINHTLMSTGDLGASLLDAVAGYESLADMLMAELTAMGLNTSTTAMIGWQGTGGVMMQMSAAEFMQVCAMASAWVRVGQIQAGEVASAHNSAVTAMIPGEVCLMNRGTQLGLIHTNFMGIHSGAIFGLEVQYQEFWGQNATLRTGYGAVVSAALAALATPAPFSPDAADPAGAAAAVAQDAAQTGGQSAMQASAKTASQVADSPVKDAASGPGGMMSSMMGQVGQLGSMFGQVTQVGQQLPQMLGQAPQMLQGFMGPLSSMQGMNGATAGAMAPGAAAGAMGMPGVGGLGALAGGAGGGGGGLMSGPSALSSTFVRPASSFSTPNSPTLPGGWQGGGEPGATGQTRPGGGGGGMYGAPPPMNRDGNSESSEKSTRTMQVTARPGTKRGERQAI